MKLCRKNAILFDDKTRKIFMRFKEKRVLSNAEKKIILDGYEWGFYFVCMILFETDEFFCPF
jgi:hypothetical protein